LQGRFSDGDRVHIDVRDDQIVFSQRERVPA
jgi:hypothetical protein